MRASWISDRRFNKNVPLSCADHEILHVIILPPITSLNPCVACPRAPGLQNHVRALDRWGSSRSCVRAAAKNPPAQAEVWWRRYRLRI